MFWDNLIRICNQKGTTPTAVVHALGIASGSVTKWKNGSEPRHTTLQKIADYFGVTVDYLLGKEETTHGNAPESFIGEFLSEDEQKIISIYRTNETFREAVNNIYRLTVQGTEPKQTVRVFRAARSADNHDAEIVEMDAERLKKLEEAPDTDDDLL